MSQSEIELIEETLKGLLTSDNIKRKQAENKLEELQNNRPALVYCLARILNSNYLKWYIKLFKI